MTAMMIIQKQGEKLRAGTFVKTACKLSAANIMNTTDTPNNVMSMHTDTKYLQIEHIYG